MHRCKLVSLSIAIVVAFFVFLDGFINPKVIGMYVHPKLVSVETANVLSIPYTKGNLDLLSDKEENFSVEVKEVSYERYEQNSEIIFSTPEEPCTDSANPTPSSGKSYGNYISDSDLRSICRSVGSQYGISEALLRAIVWCESGNYIYAQSYCGAKGLAQIMECYNRDRISRLGITDVYDPYSNIMLCADIISSFRNSKYGYSDEFVLMAYNMGEYGARSYFESGYISSYAKKVLNTYYSFL